MKIGILIWQLDIKGGTQRQALELAQYLSKAGCRVTVYAYLYDRKETYSELCDGLDIRYVKLNRDADIKDYPKTAFEYFLKYAFFFLGIKHRELFRIIDNDIDVLNPHDYGVYVTAGLWKKKNKKPVVWMMNDIPLFKWNIGNIPKTIGYHIRPRYRKYIKSFDKIVVLDNLNRSLLQKNFRKDGCIIRSGLDINKFKFLERDNNSGKYKILIISVLFPHRRMEDSVRALKYLLQWGYDVSIEHVGSTNRNLRYTRKIYGLIRRMRLESRVKFHGSISSEKLSKLLQEFDFYLFSNSPQTWGLSVFECMASGLPVVLTLACGASEVLTDRENALIVEPYSPKKIARAIELLICNKSLRKTLPENGYALIKNNMSWERYSSAMLECIKEVHKK